jgi:hypothetical protein
MDGTIFLWANIFEKISRIATSRCKTWNINTKFLFTFLGNIFYFISISLVQAYRMWIFLHFFYFYSNCTVGMIIWAINIIIMIYTLYKISNFVIVMDDIDISNDDISYGVVLTVFMCIIEFISSFYCLIKCDDTFIKLLSTINVAPLFFGIIIYLFMTQSNFFN